MRIDDVPNIRVHDGCCVLLYAEHDETKDPSLTAFVYAENQDGKLYLKRAKIPEEEEE